MKKIGKLSVLIILTLLLSILPLYNIMIKGPFHWGLGQKQFIEGGIELCICGILILLIGCWLNGRKAFSVLFFSLIYLSMNGVIIPFLIDLLYFEVIIFCGSVIISLRKEWIEIDILKAFLAGVCVWGAGAIILSALGFGTINCLRWYTVFLFAGMYILKRNRDYHSVSFRLYNYINNEITTNFCFFIFVVIVLIVLALFAKTNTAHDYDSLWYGLRPEYVLIGENSFFDDKGFLSFVYYYPKLVELLFLPISGLGDYSFICGANIFVFVIFLYAAHQIIIDKISDASYVIQLLILSLIASIPAIANISATAKPDIMGATFVLVAILFGLKYKKSGDFSYVVWAMISLLMCTGTKLTYILWGGIVFLFLVFECWSKRKKVKTYSVPKFCLNDFLVIGLSVLFVGGVHFRTFLLTGVPIYPLGISFFKKVGLDTKPFMLESFITSKAECTLESSLQRLYEFIFNPNNLGHVIFLWTTNVAILAILIYLFFKKKRRSKLEYLFLGTLTLIMLYYMLTMGIPDGNYFIIPIVLLFIFFLGGVGWSKLSSGESKVVIVIFFTFLCVHLPIMFITHPSWAYGTKAFSSELYVENCNTVEKNDELLKGCGIGLINDYVKLYNESDRVISSFMVGANHFRLECAVEGASELQSITLTNDEIMGDYEVFCEYLDNAKIKALIVSYDDNSIYSEYVNKYISEKGYVNMIVDTNAVCYEIR